MSIEFETDKSGSPVPWDRLLDSEHSFTTPPMDDLKRVFYIAHEISEALYEGNGVWRDSDAAMPLVRWTSRRVLGYIGAYRALGDEIFKTRALEGLEQLLREQKPSGTIVWYRRSLRGIDNRDDGLYETGIAGRAFIEGYKLFGDERFLKASERAARWAIDSPISPNNNYNLFAVWHLAAHYAVTADVECLDAAIIKTREGGFPEQFGSGGWPGHNSWIWYHGIMIRGMAELFNVLPEDHPFIEELRPRLIAAMNRVIREQEASGAVPSNPGLVDNSHRNAFALHGLIIAHDSCGSDLDNCIHGMARSRIATQPSSADVQEFKKACVDWETGRSEAENRMKNERIWHEDFVSFRSDDEWGEMAEEWFNAWYPVNDPDPQHVRWQKNSTDQRSGAYCQEYRVTGPEAFAGIGYRLPEGLLIPGQAYRFDVWVKLRESEGAKDSIQLLFASAYSGEPRPTWDCASDCTLMNEDPSFDEYEKISVRFTAWEANHIYVWMRAGDIPEGESVSMLVDNAQLFHEGEPLPGWRSPLRYRDWECDIMATGLYLEWRSRHASEEEPPTH